MWRLRLNIEHLCITCSNKVNLCRMLLMREDAEHLLMQTIKSCVRERETLYVVFQVMIGS